MNNPVTHFEIGAADHQALVKFYGELFGWGLREVSEGYTRIDTRGGGGVHARVGRGGAGVHADPTQGGRGAKRGGGEEWHGGALGDLLCRGGRPPGVPGPGRGAG